MSAAKQFIRGGGYRYTDSKLSKSEIHELILEDHTQRFLWFITKGIYRSSLVKEHEISFVPDTLGEDVLWNLDTLLSAESMTCTNTVFYHYLQSPNSLIRSKHKKALLDKLYCKYKNQVEIFAKHGVQNYEHGLNLYTMTHTLGMLFSNEMHYHRPFKDKMEIYRKMRNNEMIVEAFNNVSINVIHKKVWVCYLLLKIRMYFLLALITN